MQVMTAETHTKKRNILIVGATEARRTLIRNQCRRCAREQHLDNITEATFASLDTDYAGARIAGADLIFVDSQAATDAALTLIRGIRANGNGVRHDIPVILVTDTHETRMVRMFRDAGVSQFLAAPITRNVVSKALSLAGGCATTLAIPA